MPTHPKPLIELLPELTVELEKLLLDQGESELARQVSTCRWSTAVVAEMNSVHVLRVAQTKRSLPHGATAKWTRLEPTANQLKRRQSEIEALNCRS